MRSNPFSKSAKLGIVIAMVLIPEATTMQKAIVSFVFALAGTLMFMTFLRNLKVKSIIFVPLVGIMFGNIIDILSGNKEALHLMAISRLPRLISILMAGSAMSICGLIMQQISQNKFVSPTTKWSIFIFFIYWCNCSPSQCNSISIFIIFDI